MAPSEPILGQNQDNPILNQQLSHIFLKFHQDPLFDTKYGYIYRLTRLTPFKVGVADGVNEIHLSQIMFQIS